MSILILGFYDRGNLGDETYKVVFPRLLPGHTCTFCNIDDPVDVSSYRYLICGGGDLINEYFVSRIEKILPTFHGKKIALSVGISYPSYLEHPCLDLFDDVYCRNISDVRRLQRSIGHRAHYLPDAAFLMEAPASDIRIPLAKLQLQIRPRIGLFLAANAFYRHKDTTSSLHRSVLELIDHLARNYEVTLFRFNSGGTSDQDDVRINSWMMKHIAFTSRPYVSMDSTVYTPEAMLSQMRQLDIALCMRYHAHVFATIVGLPIVSLNISRKAGLLMLEMNLSEYICLPRSDPNGAALSFDLSEVVSKLRSLQLNRVSVVSQLLSYAERSRFLLRSCHSGILSQPRTAIVARLNRCLNPDQIVKELLEHSNRVDMRQMAQLISLKTTGRRISEYNYGTEQHLQNMPLHAGKLRSMVEWILQDLAAKRRYDRKFNLDYMLQDDYRGLHRAGWSFVMDGLRSLSYPNGVLLDTFIDRTFHWEERNLIDQGIIPYTSPWVGFLHHTNDTTYSPHNAVDLFAKESFRASLSSCCGLYVLSETLANWCRDALTVLGHSDILVDVLIHPTAFVRRNFSLGKYHANTNKRLILIGAWYREPFSIYELCLPNQCPLRKCALRGPRMESSFLPDRFHLNLAELFTSTPVVENASEEATICRPTDRGILSNKWIRGLLAYYSIHHYPVTSIDYDVNKKPSVSVYDLSGQRNNLLSMDLETKISSVTILPHHSDDAYDELLEKNLVFLKLVDASAVNTVIECIVRSTPIVVNRLPALEEALGKEYPLFYDRLEEVGSLLTDANIERAYNYLTQLDTERYRLENFLASIKASRIYTTLD